MIESPLRSLVRGNRVRGPRFWVAGGPKKLPVVRGGNAALSVGLRRKLSLLRRSSVEKGGSRGGWYTDRRCRARSLRESGRGSPGTSERV